MRIRFDVDAFSLVECMIVLSLIFIIVVLSVPHLSFFNKRLVRADIEKMVMTASYLQRFALVSGRKQELHFDQSHKQYMSNGRVYKLNDRVLFDLVAGAPGPPSIARRAVSSPITFDRQRIIFYPDGKIQPGSVYLVDHEKRFGYALTVAVSHISCIREYYYNNGVWESVA